MLYIGNRPLALIYRRMAFTFGEDRAMMKQATE